MTIVQNILDDNNKRNEYSITKEGNINFINLPINNLLSYRIVVVATLYGSSWTGPDCSARSTCCCCCWQRCCY